MFAVDSKQQQQQQQKNGFSPNVLVDKIKVNRWRSRLKIDEYKPIDRRAGQIESNTGNLKSFSANMLCATWQIFIFVLLT